MKLQKPGYEDGDELCGSCGERIEDCNDLREKDER